MRKKKTKIELDNVAEFVDKVLDADGADDHDGDADTNREGGSKQPRQADILIGLAKAATLFHAPAPDSGAMLLPTSR